MINKHMEIPSLFGDLRFIVVDEIHSLLFRCRGRRYPHPDPGRGRGKGFSLGVLDIEGMKQRVLS